MALDGIRVSIADDDVRYVPGETDNFCSIAHESRYQWAIEQFNLAGKAVLDFGCGSGYGTAMLAGAAQSVVGLDYSSTAIEYARERYGSTTSPIEFHSLDACADTVPGQVGAGRFDMVISFDVIEHIERYYDYLDNITKLLAAGGECLIGCPNRLQTFSWNRNWNIFHFQEFSPHQLRHILSPYFDDVVVYSQDFVSTEKRERVRSALMRKKSRMEWILGKLSRPLLPEPVTGADIRFLAEPDSAILDNAFGLVAHCVKRA